MVAAIVPAHGDPKGYGDNESTMRCKVSHEEVSNLEGHGISHRWCSPLHDRHPPWLDRGGDVLSMGGRLEPLPVTDAAPVRSGANLLHPNRRLRFSY